MQDENAIAAVRPGSRSADPGADPAVLRLLGNELSQLYVGAGPVTSDDEFHQERLRMLSRSGIREIALAGGHRARLVCPMDQPVNEAAADILRSNDPQPVALIKFAVFAPANEKEMWAAMRGDLQDADEAFYLLFFTLQGMAATFDALGPVALVWRMQFRPSAELTGHEQAALFQAFMDGLRAQHRVGLAVMSQDNHSAPLLLMELGATLRFGGTFYTPLTRKELEAAGAPGQNLIAHCCWRTQEEHPAEPAPTRDSPAHACAQT